MKKLLSIVIFVVLLLSIVATIAIAKGPNAKGPHSKVTGNINFIISQEREVNAYFNAHDFGEAGEDKGELSFEMIVSGLYYKINVYSVNIVGNEAFVAGQVYDSNIFSNGDWIYVYLTDGDTPGRNGDAWWATKNTKDTVLGWVDSEYKNEAAQTPVIEGNLVVHN